MILHIKHATLELYFHEAMLSPLRFSRQAAGISMKL